MSDENIQVPHLTSTMKKTITDIRIEDEQPSFCMLFMDGEPFDIVRIDLVTKFGLRIGMETEHAVVEKLIAADEVMRAKTQARGFLELESYSKERMMRALERHGFSERAIRETLDYLGQLGNIKDEKFARNWMSKRQRTNPRSKRLLTHELIDKGIDRGTVDQVVGRIDDDDEKQLAVCLAQKQVLRYRSVPQHVAQRRLRGFLLRRGFDCGAIQWAVKEVLAVG